MSNSVTFSGLVLHYTCDDTVTTDTSGNNNTGTLAGSGTTLATGLIGNKLTFNGSGYITFTSTALLGLASATSEISISCWIKTTQANATIVSLRSASGIANLVLGDNGYEGAGTGTLALVLRGDNGAGLLHFNNNPALNNGNWRHIVWTRSISATQFNTLYVDGSPIVGVVDSLTGGITPTVANSAIGFERVANSTTYRLNGDLDDFQVYNRALAASEVTSIYTGGRGFVTLPANIGAFAFTGVTATPLLGKVLSANTGAFVTTGIAAGGLSKRILPATVTPFVVTGNDIALQRTGALTMTANTGVFAFTGTSTGIVSSYVMSAVTGAFTLNGINAGWGGIHIMPAAPGALVFTGQPATFLHGVARLTMSPGSFVFTGIWVIFDLEHVISGGPPPGETSPVMPGVLNMGRKVWIRPGRWC